jgi:hypothetical protein
MVLPLIPMPMENITDRATVRSILEFFSWFEDLPETEVRLLSETRKEFVSHFLPRNGPGGGVVRRAAELCHAGGPLQQ